MAELDLLVMGDVNPDVVLSAPGLDVRFGQEEQLVDSSGLVLGGSGAITAAAASRLGVQVGLCAVVGDDDLGALLAARLTDLGVETENLSRDRRTATGLTVILDRGGDRALLTSPGATERLGPEHLDALPDRPARHVHVSSYFLMSDGYRRALPEALRRFRASGVTISLDTNWDPSGRWDVAEVLAEVDAYLPNEAELMAVTGSRLVERAVAQLAGFGCAVVVKRGELGALALVGDELFRVARTPAVHVVDTVGAGDTFVGAYLAGTLTGCPVSQALAMAVVAGTLSTREAGGTAGQPDRDEVAVRLDGSPVTVQPADLDG